jgi:hypothetical protein
VQSLSGQQKKDRTVVTASVSKPLLARAIRARPDVMLHRRADKRQRSR